MGSEEGVLKEFVELSLSLRLQTADTLLQFSEPSLVRIQDSQDGDLSFRRDGAPEGFRVRRLKNHATCITKSLYKRFDR